ncbi:cytochrome P450 [Actinomadura rudentiformis]|uniref:Cytochrome P450 n=1 Tax=Actinomadura rudentiformis TaxID=359158 RepID=A0A6H9Z425_9ACTN|nr:cytochrome P450 [Actinomadura rudentiformis]KAB2348272.1 cytochrome P450 [Actinomadura rudentiformis]
MTGTDVPELAELPEIDLTDVEVIRDPFAAYGRARERSPLARLLMPGQEPWWVVTRYEQARAMLSDPRFEINEASFMRPDVPDDCVPYMRTMSEMNGQEHARLRKLVSPAFSPRRAAAFRPRIEAIVERLIDEAAEHADDGVLDLLPHFARPLPMDVICDLVGIPESDRLMWRAYGATVAAAAGEDFAKAIPGIMEGAKAAIARRRAEPADDLISGLINAQAEGGDRLTDTELVTLIWHLVMAGQTPINLIANAMTALLAHPEQLAALRADSDNLMPLAVEELTRWCGSTLLTIPRYANEDTEISGVPVRKGDAVTVSVAATNRDPRVFADPERLDITRPQGTPAHLGFAHGPHFCLGASIGRVQTQVALTALLRRFPDLALAPGTDPAELRALDPGTWRVTALPVSL